MYLPKKDVYNSLKELPCFVAQSKPAVFNELPAVIFGVGNNAVIADLDGEISSQDVEIQIDIWAEDSSTCLLYTSPSPRDRSVSRMPSSA